MVTTTPQSIPGAVAAPVRYNQETNTTPIPRIGKYINFSQILNSIILIDFLPRRSLNKPTYKANQTKPLDTTSIMQNSIIY